MKNVKIGSIAVALAGVLGAGLASAQQQGGGAQAPTTQPRTPTAQPRSNGKTSTGQPGMPTTTGTQGPAGMSLTATTPEEAMRDIEQTLGFVPQWFRMVPDHMLVGFWDSMKGLLMNPATQLDGKTKELIGLAVAAQIPCEYCVYYHTAAARKNGATDQEIKEAIGVAAVTRMGSTVLNGSQVDKNTFRKDTDRMLKGDVGRSQARSSSTPRR